MCRVCQRGHSPQSNMIVFCDGCNTPYHQYCHDPPIGDEVVKVEEKEWFCSDCVGVRQEGGMGGLAEVDLRKAVSGEGLLSEEVRLAADIWLIIVMSVLTKGPTRNAPTSIVFSTHRWYRCCSMQPRSIPAWPSFRQIPSQFSLSLSHLYVPPLSPQPRPAIIATVRL